MDSKALARFERKYRVEDRGYLTPCWVWTGSTHRQGYGTFTISIPGPKRTHLTHKIRYEHAFGPVEHGLELDHLCRIVECCNPEHLEPVTHRENVLRGRSDAAGRAVRTQCEEGHEYTAANTTIRSDGGRRCMICKRARTNALRARQRVAKATRI